MFLVSYICQNTKKVTKFLTYFYSTFYDSILSITKPFIVPWERVGKLVYLCHFFCSKSMQIAYPGSEINSWKELLLFYAFLFCFHVVFYALFEI